MLIERLAGKSHIVWLSSIALFLFASLTLLAAPAYSNDSINYFLDSTLGSDSNDGTQGSPWRTFDKAWSEAPSGATVLVSGGTYGGFTIDAPRPELESYVTFRAVDGKTPVLDGVSVIFQQAGNAYVRLEGFDIRRSGGNVVALHNARHIQIVDSEIHADKWAKAGNGAVGVYLLGGEDVLLADNHLHEIHRGMTVGDTTGAIIRGNLIQPKGGTGIQYVGGNRAGLIEGNHIQGAAYTGYPANPDAVPSPHASIISVRSSDLVIRGNLLHGLGSSSGIMFYEPDAAGGQAAYSNIVLENNALFNTFNNNAIRIYNLGDNFRLSNNLIFSTVREGDCNGLTKDARYRYNTALAVHSIADGYDGSGLELYNNIFIGALSLNDRVKESNNVIWSWFNGTTWLSNTPRSNSVIVASDYGGCGNHPPLFEDGSFFESPLDFASLKAGDVPNLRLAASSLGANFGDPENRPAGSLGSIGPDGFLRDDGVARTSPVYNIGPYERFQQNQQSPSPTVLRIE